jgi:hypothetical protein
VPDAGETASHPALALTDQLQPASVVTVIVPAPPDAANSVMLAAAPIVHGEPLCRTVAR